jgi:C-terminal processing protease CtpA/Prc
VLIGIAFWARRKRALALTGALLLSSCGGGGGSGPSGGSADVPAPTPTPTPTQSAASECSLRARQDWAAGQLQEWYLFPSLLSQGVEPTSHPTVQSYIDALVAPARAQNRDRFFTYLTSIAQENAFYQQGATAGFGFRLLLDQGGRRLYISEAFEGGPALNAGIDRGAEITHVGTSPTDWRSVSELLATGGSAALSNALGPDTPGTSRTFAINTPGVSNRAVVLTKVDFALDPVSDRYGATVIADGARKVGYVNLRTFIDTADPNLRAAFASFKAQGISELIIDLRYNGGGLISVAELMGDLMGDGRQGQIFSYTTHRDTKAAFNREQRIAVQEQSIAPTKIAFIGTGSTASASELVINGMVPFLRNNMALIGSNTYGKPVGQVALDRPQCDDRLRAVAIKVENAERQGEYYNGLATTVPVTCRAADDITRQLGDPAESMVRAALDYLAGRSCTPIGGITTQALNQRALLTPAEPASTIERELPGVF